MTYVRQMMEDERGYSDEQWKKMAELGWTGLIIPEQYGGAGLNMVDMVVVLEEMGTRRHAGAVLRLGDPRRRVPSSWAASDAQKKRYLPDLAAGKLKATLAQVEESGRWDAEGIALPAKSDGGGLQLSTAPSSSCTTRTTPTCSSCRSRTGGRRRPTASRCCSSTPRRRASRSRVLKTMDQTRKLCEVQFDDVARRRGRACSARSARGGRCSIASSIAPRSRCAPRCAAARRRCSR